MQTNLTFLLLNKQDFKFYTFKPRQRLVNAIIFVAFSRYFANTKFIA